MARGSPVRSSSAAPSPLPVAAVRHRCPAPLHLGLRQRCATAVVGPCPRCHRAAAWAHPMTHRVPQPTAAVRHRCPRHLHLGLRQRCATAVVGSCPRCHRAAAWAHPMTHRVPQPTAAVRHRCPRQLHHCPSRPSATAVRGTFTAAVRHRCPAAPSPRAPTAVRVSAVRRTFTTARRRGAPPLSAATSSPPAPVTRSADVTHQKLPLQGMGADGGPRAIKASPADSPASLSTALSLAMTFIHSQESPFESRRPTESPLIPEVMAHGHASQGRARPRRRAGRG